MSRSQKIVRNLVIFLGLCLLFITQTALYLTPLSAHEHSERSLLYGPSEVVHVEDFDEGKYILAKYDRWYSCNSVERTLGLFWRSGGGSIGTENDKTKAVAFSWSASYEHCVAYGIINDDRVKRIELTLSNGQVLTQTKFYDRMFLILWTDKNNNNYFEKLIGYDASDKVIFESELP
ncbi:hypothetical protein [Desulfosporosinus hippei]|uniref:Uncharacterized protein n=1 Tax=Desulfosporosinus hippei DSM 8344 TaxID=1121419 RepID=A0A1G8CUX6_9FIRM|nr:hypothetical protein [Desulfosporosinus hippei]SDH49347.1 hypothetical protein SAMN05443529_11435 [Desulfosporosinus hippei DSM 8344]